jgi:hypothetical protein
MKFLAILAFVSLSSQAAILDDVGPYVGKKGVAIEFNNHVGSCQLGVAGEILTLEGPYYVTPFIELDAQLKESHEEGNVYLSKSNGKRPGGDECGDLGGMFSFKKNLVVNKKTNTISIIKSFRCILDAGRKTILEASCQFR